MIDVIMQLASTAASTLVSAMATDLWGDVRRAVGRLFNRGNAELAANMDEILTESYDRVRSASESERAQIARDVEGEWRGALRQLLTADPDSAAEMREFITRYAGTVAQQATVVHQTVRVSGHGTAYTSARDQFITLQQPEDGDAR